MIRSSSVARRAFLTSRAWIALAVVALASASCGGGGSPGGAGPSGPGPRGTMTTALELAPAQPPADSDFTVTLRYQITPATVLLGSYLLEVRFDSSQAEFVAPDPAMNPDRLVNPVDAGTIIVGGAVSQGFRDGLLFKGRFRSRPAAAVTPATLQLTIREAVDTRLESLILN